MDERTQNLKILEDFGWKQGEDFLLKFFAGRYEFKQQEAEIPVFELVGCQWRRAE